MEDTLKSFFRMELPNPVESNGCMTAIYPSDSRLGNLMFIYATLLGVAEKLNKTPVFAEGMLSNTFSLTAPLGYIDIRLGSSAEDYTEFGRRACAYDRDVLKIQGRNIKLHGYWQSWKYFSHIDHKIRKEYVFKEVVTSLVDKTIKDIKSLNPKKLLIGIHVRRADMMRKDKSSYGYTTAPASYITKAMDYMESKHSKNVIYIIASDDLRWCRRNIVKKSKRTIILTPFRKVDLDLAIISKCDHVILTVGSYGWWAAWLANGTTIYYSKWPRPNSQLEYHVNKADYFPPHWVPIGN